MSLNPNATHKIFSSRTNTPAGTFIGEAGRLFYNEATGELRLSDGHTPGGQAIVITANLSDLPPFIGDVTSAVVGANVVTTLATVNSNIGTYTVQTVNAKGLVTSASNLVVTGDVTGTAISGNLALTLDTVNSNVGMFGNDNSVAKITVNAKGLVTSAANITITPASIGAININQLGVANGVATLDNLGRLTAPQIPEILTGSVTYQGTWDASTNSPIIISGVGTLGYFYKVKTAGTFNIDLTSNWNVGDTIIFDGTKWEKIAAIGSDVISVFGRDGLVTATLASADFINQGTTTTVLHGNAGGNPSWGAVNLTTDVVGTLQAAQVPAFVGDATTTTGNLFVTLATVNSNIGTFGDAATAVQVTVNGKGLVTSISNVAIPHAVMITGDATGSGTTSSNTAITLNTVNSNVGTFGDANDVATFTVNGKGLITSASNVAIPNAVTITGDATGSGTTSSNAVITLNTVNSNVGMFGNVTTIPQIVVNAKGLVTSVSNITVPNPTIYPGPGIANSTGTSWDTSYNVTGTGNVVLDHNATISATNLTVTNSITGNINGQAITALTVTNAAQPNITSVGTLTSLTLGGNLSLPNTEGQGILTNGAYGWRDLTGYVTPKSVGSTAPTIEAFNSVIRGWAYSAGDEGDITYHLPHDYAPGTDLFLHVHWSHNGTNIEGTFQANITASYGSRDGIFSSAVIPQVTVSSLSIGNTPQCDQRVDEIQFSTPGGTSTLLDTNLIEVDGLININYSMNIIPAIANSPTSVNLPFIWQIDLHYQSTTVGTKNKAPNFYS